MESCSVSYKLLGKYKERPHIPTQRPHKGCILNNGSQGCALWWWWGGGKFFRGHLATFGDIFGILGCHRWKGLLLASSRLRPEVLVLNKAPCTGLVPAKNYPIADVNSANAEKPRSRRICPFYFPFTFLLLLLLFKSMPSLSWNNLLLEGRREWRLKRKREQSLFQVTVPRSCRACWRSSCVTCKPLPCPGCLNASPRSFL